MLTRHLLVLLLALSVFAASRAESQTISGTGGRIPTIGELLKRHGIQLTQPALIDALRNADPEIRYLAAEKLVEDKAVETVPAITEALRSEKLPRTRMNIAFALAQFGQTAGFEALEKNCSDRDLEGGVRTQSADYVTTLHRESAACFDATLDVLQTGGTGYRMQAASLLPRFRNLSKQDSERVFEALVQSLHSSDESVQMAASHALASIGDQRAIAELQDAVAREQDEVIRSQFEQDIRTLRTRLQR
jgi:HEAT repeat protein